MHEGSQFPENSLVAFAAALELGAGIECDLRLTADNRIVVFHDRDACRMCGSPMKIGESTLAEIGRLSVGGHPVPTLESLLTLVAGRVPLLLEVKTKGDIWRWVPALRAGLADYSGRFAVMMMPWELSVSAMDAKSFSIQHCLFLVNSSQGKLWL